MNDTLSDDLASLRIRRDDPPPSRPWGRVLVALAVAGGLAFAGLRLAPSVEGRLFKTEVQVTEVSSVSPSQSSVDVTSTGYVIPQVVAKVGAKITGRVARVAVHEGEVVKSGQILFELDAADQKSAIASAQARVASARARVMASRANVAEIDMQHERQKKLVASGAVASATAEDLGARADALRAQVKASEAEVYAAQAEVDALGVGLKSTTIPSPIDGTALTKPAQVGDVVSPGAVLVELADFATLLIETDVPEGRLHFVKAGGPVEIVLDAEPDRRFRGKVVEVSPRMNRAKATGTAKVAFVDAPSALRPDMSARVSFLARPLEEAQLREPAKVIIPATAIVDRSAGKGVFVIDAGGKVRLVGVVVGAPFGAGFELKEGPPPGTRVVNNPPPALADGQSIKERTS